VRRLFVGLALASAVWCAAACERTEPGAGSNTNWLRPCANDGECGDGSSCLCGACSALCDSECSSLPNAVCASPGSASVREQCGATLDQGLCLPACAATADCAVGQLCVDGACLELASPTPGSTGCGSTASLELVASATTLQARYGTVFSEALYLPVEYAEPPADWMEPAPPRTLTARVTDAGGEPLEGCAVRFITGEGSGIAFATAETTDARGEVTAHWVAGDARRQALSAALLRDDGTVATREVEGLAYANDEGAQSEAAERVVATRPSTLRLYYDLPVTSERVRVSVSPQTVPHHAFYAPIALPGFYTGIQNTGDLDPDRDAVPDAERALIASVWNLEEGDAEQLFGVEELSCSPHDDDRGGIRCMLPSAWSSGEAVVFEVERRSLAPGESVPEYEGLGYALDPCASAAGCTDYTVFFGTDVGALTRVVAYRYQSGDVAQSFSSFLQPYASLPSQNSCLSTPRYDVTFSPSIEAEGGFEPIRGADFDVDYASWRNQVCANYSASADARGYRLVTGGPTPLGAPLIEDEPPRLLTLP
jgi:hypothetical protein